MNILLEVMFRYSGDSAKEWEDFLGVKIVCFFSLETAERALGWGNCLNDENLAVSCGIDDLQMCSSLLVY